MFKAMYMLIGSAFTAGVMGVSVLKDSWGWMFVFAAILLIVTLILEYNPKSKSK